MTVGVLINTNGITKKDELRIELIDKNKVSRCFRFSKEEYRNPCCKQELQARIKEKYWGYNELEKMLGRRQKDRTRVLSFSFFVLQR